MALTSYLSLEGKSQGAIEGDCVQKGREKTILVQEIAHAVEIPRDLQSGLPTGQRIHHPFVITKAIDEASPLLYQACTAGEQMANWELQYFRINETGNEENYYTVKLENAIIVNIKHYKPMAFMEENKPFRDMEEVSFTYEKITWTHNIGSKEASDDWKEPNE